MAVYRVVFYKSLILKTPKSKFFPTFQYAIFLNIEAAWILQEVLQEVLQIQPNHCSVLSVCHFAFSRLKAPLWQHHSPSPHCQIVEAKINWNQSLSHTLRWIPLPLFQWLLLPTLVGSTPPLAKFSKWSPKKSKTRNSPLQMQGPQCIVDQKINLRYHEK